MSTAKESLISPLRQHQQDTLVRMLREAQRPCSSSELAAALGLPDGRTVAWHLRHLASLGRIRTTKIGKLRLYQFPVASRQEGTPAESRSGGSG